MFYWKKKAGRHARKVTYGILLEKLPQSPSPNVRNALRQCSRPGLDGRTDGQQNGQKLE